MIHAISVHGGDNMMARIDIAFDFDSNNHGRCDKKATEHLLCKLRADHVHARACRASWCHNPH
jgi:hypothetical protein